MKEVTITDKSIIKLFEEKNLVQKEVIAIQKFVEEKDKEIGKLAHKLQKIKDKMIPKVEKAAGTLEEFEVITRLDKNEKGELFVEVVDQVEEYKDTLRNREK
jgi:hypothetical protein